MTAEVKFDNRQFINYASPSTPKRDSHRVSQHADSKMQGRIHSGLSRDVMLEYDVLLRPDTISKSPVEVGKKSRNLGYCRTLERARVSTN